LVRLLRATDDHFAWLLNEAAAPRHLRQPPGGVDTPEMLRMMRGMLARLHAAGCNGHWLILDRDEVVGLCGYTHPPDEAREVDIGYGIAASRRRRGYATGAVGLMVRQAWADPAIDTVAAMTVLDNVASHGVLKRNGFARLMTRDDPDEGPVIIWRLKLPPKDC
jgi:RimJ/RimL family protein N-acetyltransferase